MAMAPIFALVTYQAFSRKQLLELVKEIIAWDASFAGRNTKTNDAAKALIKEARQAYWDRQAAPAPSAHKASPARRSALCAIDAAEANEWLQSLPAQEGAIT